eukprot:TRINITY_DN36158_c0_g1_i2.p1 TRINITY_DN36158_c0_g1~~TRINITY_DN36158_c0_g1_i2.p1  ORF type:complete len:293 (+),score=93.48 TRINITY_DN36158_c0_g1_i2:220-1098(+)
MEEEAAAVEEELEALQMIYIGDEDALSCGLVCQRPVITMKVHPCVLLTITLPVGYPSIAAPVVSLQSSMWQMDSLRASLEQGVQQLWEEGERQPCCYAAIEQLRTSLAARLPEPEDPPAKPSPEKADVVEAVEAPFVAEEVVEEWDCPGVVSGEVLTDRKSHFQAHLAVCSSKSQVDGALWALYQNNKIQRATHNMWAYRLWDEDRGVQRADNDDDGEDAAGAKMAALLDVMGAQNVLVVVSRWYGGIHLGPDRFKHIANLTQQILTANGFQRRGGKASRSSKKDKKMGEKK